VPAGWLSLAAAGSSRARRLEFVAGGHVAGLLAAVAGPVSIPEAHLVELVSLQRRRHMNWISTPGATPFLVVAFITFSVTGSLLLRVAGQHHGWLAVIIFIAGNCSGFVAATTLTMTLRGRHPNLIYAFCLGGGFCVLQLMARLLFKVPLTPWQWFGIGLMAAGMICLQLQIR
jgi:multidrug transporter EmrE-like cation transporter